MRRGRQSWRRPLKDFLRLAHADDLLSRLGSLMIRTSPKATIWTAGIVSSGYLSNHLGLPGFSGWEALMAPVVVGGGLLGLGLAIRFVPSVLAAKWVAVAEASDLNLMEDYRKSQAPAHLNVLWDKVFFHESSLRHSPQERQAERDELRQLRGEVRRQVHAWDRETLKRLELDGDEDADALAMAVLCERALCHNQEKSREGFMLSSLYALRHALPQCCEAHAIGFRLGLYEHLCDGAYFDRSDTKLAEQYAGNPLLQDIKGAVGFGRVDALRRLPASLAARVWCFLVTRRIATGVGRAVQYLNLKHRTDTFNSQVFLWPGQEAAPWLDAFPGAAQEILTLRKSIVRSALGSDYERACAVLDRMFLTCFESATDLRARYDPEYCEGSLDYVAEDTGEKIVNNLVADLRARGYRQETLDRAARYADTVRREQADFAAYLAKSGPEGLLKDPPARRAVRIAFHVNYRGMKDAVRAHRSDGSSASLDQAIQAAIAEKAAYDRRLVGLRLHHELTRLLLDSYKDLARTLAY